MFDTIGESTVRTVLRPENVSAVTDKEIQAQRAEKLREARPVEKNEDSTDLKNDAQKKERTTKYDLEEKVIVFEKYNRNGEVVFRMPPKQNPVDELA
jgi:hypothetical protein